MAVACEARGGKKSLHPPHCLARLTCPGGIVLQALAADKAGEAGERGIGVGNGFGSARWGLLELAEVEDVLYCGSVRTRRTGGRVAGQASQGRNPLGAAGRARPRTPRLASL